MGRVPRESAMPSLPLLSLRPGSPLANDTLPMIEPSPMKLVPDAVPVDAVPEAPAAPAESSKWALWTLSAFILVVGLVLRIWPSAGYTSTGFDEVLYQINVAKLEKTGFLGYDQICQIHIEDQRKPETTAKLPPTRFVYIAAAYLWKKVEFGDAPPLSRHSARRKH